MDVQFQALEQTEEFTRLNKTFRAFVFPVTIGFLAWYIFYIVTATFAIDFVSTPVWGYVNLGLILGVAQFVTAGLITWAYVRFADNKLDPQAATLRAMANQEGV